MFQEMNKFAIPGVILCSILLISYYMIWPPADIPDDIPKPSCSDMARSANYRSKNEPQIEDIMVGICLTDQMGYTDFTSSVIRKYHSIADSIIHVFVDKEHHYGRRTLLRWYGNRTNVIYTMSKQNSALKALELFVNSRYKMLFLIDSEMVFMRTWRDFIKKNLLSNKAPLLSLYHSATMHSYTADCENFEGNICRGKIPRTLGVAMTNEFAKTVVTKYPRYLQDYRWDKILESEKLQGLYPRNSIIVRIGQTNQDKNFCGENDVPYRFNLCELPCWIRNGIEFYFDRCTNPQELYSPESSILHADIEKRLWVRPVVAYSFYGNKSKYVNGAIENARRVFSIYPGWKIWIYVDDSASLDVAYRLCSYNVRFLNMTGSHIKNQMSWRFLIAAEPVKYFTILDIDYRMLSRGKEATDEWLQSGRKFHVMRDHPNHSKYPMNGQMWGGFGSSITNIKELIMNYNGKNKYMIDMYFLRDRVWPIVEKSVWVHDAYSLHKFGEDHPFPTKRIRGRFVGNVDFN